MALVTDSDQIPHSVGTAHAAVLNVMDVKNRSILCLPSTALAGITVTGKDCFTECSNAVPLPSLIIFSFWNRCTCLHSLQNLSVKLPHLHRDGGDGYDSHEPLEICKILVFAVFDRRRKPTIFLFAIVKSRLPMTKSGTSLLTVHTPVIVVFLLIRKGTHFHGR